MFGSERLDSLLRGLGELLETESGPEVRLVVSGGAALIAHGIVERVTADIDVFAQRELEGDLISGYPLPGWFKIMVERFAEVENLPKKWINADTSLVGNALTLLPPRCLQSLEEHRYGARLRVSFLKRDAQLYLKGYAIFGRDEPRDSKDFRALRPTPAEIRAVVEWLRENELIGVDMFAEVDSKLKDAAYG